MTMRRRFLILLQMGSILFIYVIMLLIQTQVLRFTSSPANVIIFTSLLFGFPGVSIAYKLIDRKDLSIIDKLALSLVFGAQLLNLLGTVLLIFRSTLTTYSQIIIIFNSILLIANLYGLFIKYKKSENDIVIDRFILKEWVSKAWKSIDKETFISRLLFGIYFIFFFYLLMNNPTRLAGDGDAFMYQPYIRHFADTLRLDPTGAYANWSDLVRFGFIGLNVITALVLKVTQADLPDMWNIYLPLLLSAISILSVNVFHKALFKKRALALFASTIYILYLIITLAPDNGVIITRGGNAMFFRILEDKAHTAFFLMPTALIMMLWFLEDRKLKYLVLFALSAAAIAATHPTGYFGLALQVGLFAIISVCVKCMPLLLHLTHRIREVDRRSIYHDMWTVVNELKKFGILTAIVASFIVFPLLQSTTFFGIQYDPSLASAGEQSFNPDLSPSGMEAYIKNLQLRSIVSLGNGKYVMALGWIKEPIIILSLLLAVVSFLYIRKEVVAQFIIATFVCPIVLLYIPFVVSIFSHFIPPTLLYRVGWLFPVGAVIGFALDKFINTIERLLVSWRQSIKKFTWLFPLVTLLVLNISLAGQINHGIKSLQAFHVKWTWPVQRDHDMRDVIKYVENNTVDKNTFLADYSILKYLPTYTTKTTNTLIFGQIEPRRTETAQLIANLRRLEYIDVDTILFMQQYDVDYIIWDRKSLPNYQFELMTRMFELLYQNNTYSLYKVKDLRLTNEIIGNFYLAKGDWEEAIAEYTTAIAARTDDAATYFGLGRAYYALGNWDMAVTNYSRSVFLSSMPMNTLNYIDIGVDSEYLEQYLVERNDYQSSEIESEDEIVVYNFLDQISDYIKNGKEYQSIQRQTFVIDGIPRGIIYQPAPSQISFNLTIPPLAYLQFYPTIAAGVWAPGKGDGVQFNIYIKNLDSNSQLIFSEYLDPKNVLSLRHWSRRSLNLSKWSGQNVVLTFETAAGPKNDNSYDWAGWGEPRIIQSVSFNFMNHLKDAKLSGSGEVKILYQTINFDARPIIFQHPTSQIKFPIKLPAESMLRFGIGMAPEVWSSDKGDGVQYSIYVRTSQSPSVLYKVFTYYLDPKNNANDRCWRDFIVDLSSFGKQDIDLIFEALPGKEEDASYDWGGWSFPVLVDMTYSDSN